jgi:hypothetical protein
MSDKLQESESFEHFKRIVPQNPVPWEGTVVLYSPWCNTFFNVAFGTGDNLGDEDIDNGFDDYIMVDQFELDGTFGFGDVVNNIKHAGYAEGDMAGLDELDGGQWLLRHKDWRNGDIRRFIMEAMDFAGYGLPKGTPKEMFHKDVIYVCSDYDNLNDIKHGGNKWRNT